MSFTQKHYCIGWMVSQLQHQENLLAANKHWLYRHSVHWVPAFSDEQVTM